MSDWDPGRDESYKMSKKCIYCAAKLKEVLMIDTLLVSHARKSGPGSHLRPRGAGPQYRYF